MKNLEITLTVKNPKNPKQVRKAIYDFIISDDQICEDHSCWGKGKNKDEYFVYNDSNEVILTIKIQKSNQ